MGGLKTIFHGMANIVGQAEAQLAYKINGLANNEMYGDPGTGVGNGPGGADIADVTPGPEAGEGLATENLIELQYDVQRFSIFNNMATSTMQTVAGAYQSVTGNLNFR